jgi:CubicO group peptidase (beta-lactamase class C family)
MVHRAGLGRGADRAFGAAQRRQLESVAPSEVDMRAAAVATLRSILALASRGRYDYSTFGYVLLGQAIERASGEPYAAVCARTVLAPAGVADARLDPVWGFRYAAGGWGLSGREYLGFFRRMPPSAEWLGAALTTWALDPVGKETQAPAFYSLGIIVRPSGELHAISHGGSLAWKQHTSRNGLLYNSTQTYAARNAAGISFFAFGEFCYPDSPGCFSDPGWGALSRQIFEATKAR